MKIVFTDQRLNDSVRIIKPILDARYFDLPDIFLKVVPHGTDVCSGDGIAMPINDIAVFCPTDPVIIYLNNDKFFGTEMDIQTGILAHEFAHFVIAMGYHTVFTTNEELDADWLVCSWGLESKLVKVRDAT
jgi:hypothetical protein